MGIPVVIKASGGMPVTVAANGYGTPMTEATNGYGVPVTVVASGGLPVVGISGGGSGFATFDGTPSTAFITLSNGNLTITKNATAQSGTVKSTAFKSTGKYYFELTNTVKSASTAHKIGVATAASDVFSNTGVVTAAPATNTFINSNDIDQGKNLGTAAAGNRYDFAIDLTNRFAWVRRNGGLWNAPDAADNPATGVGGVVIGAGSFAPAVYLSVNTAVDSVTANFGASAFVGAVPAGFTAGWPTASGGYTGPGNTVSGATAYWGLRAYTAAYAAGSGPCLDLGMTSDGTAAVTINFTAAGYIDTAAVTAAFAAGKTKVMKLYDHVGSNHMIPAFAGGQAYAPLLTSNAGPGGNTLAMDFGTGAAALESTNNITVAQPYSYLALAKVRTGAGGFPAISGGMTNTNLYFAFRTGAGTLVIQSAASEVAQAFSTNAWHAASAGVTGASGGTVAFDFDGVQTSGSPAGTVGFAAEKIGWGTNGLGGFWNGWLCELGIWPLGLSPAQQTSLNANMHTRWGF